MEETGKKAETAYIQSPAFFGENVLYYDDPPPRTYSVKCLTRTELTTVKKEDVEHVLRELPYLREAFESFRDHVLQQRRPGKGQKEGNAFLSTSAAEPKVYNSKSSQQGFHDSDSDVFETEQFQLGRSASGRLRF